MLTSSTKEGHETGGVPGVTAVSGSLLTTRRPVRRPPFFRSRNRQFPGLLLLLLVGVLFPS